MFYAVKVGMDGVRITQRVTEGIQQSHIAFCVRLNERRASKGNMLGWIEDLKRDQDLGTGHCRSGTNH